VSKRNAFLRSIAGSTGKKAGDADFDWGRKKGSRERRRLGKVNKKSVHSGEEGFARRSKSGAVELKKHNC